MTGSPRARRRRPPRRTAPGALAAFAALAVLPVLAAGGCGGATVHRQTVPTPAPTVLPPAVGGMPAGTTGGPAASSSAASSAYQEQPSAPVSSPGPVEQAAVAFCVQYFSVRWDDGSPTASQKRAASFMTPSYTAKLAATTTNGGGRDWQLFVAAKRVSTAHVKTAIIVPEAPRTADLAYVQAAVDVITTDSDGTGAKEELKMATLTMVRRQGAWLVDGMHF